MPRWINSSRFEPATAVAFRSVVFALVVVRYCGVVAGQSFREICPGHPSPSRSTQCVSISEPESSAAAASIVRNTRSCVNTMTWRISASHEPQCDPAFSFVILRRDRVIEDDARVRRVQPDLGEKVRQGNGPLFALAQISFGLCPPLMVSDRIVWPRSPRALSSTGRLQSRAHSSRSCFL
jgi:hypothetical protein